MITLTINGSPAEFPQTLNLNQLVEHYNLTGKRLAIERNGEIVPRSQFDQTQVQAGDKIEIVVAVGGG
jgi:sulfur carrier protein